MALEEFWGNVRQGMQMYRPPRALQDSPRLTREEIQAALVKPEFWLKAATVKGYDPADFSFLSDELRDELTQLVADFRAIVSQIPPRKPATPAQADAALPHFHRIVEILEFDRYADANAFRIGKTIEADPAFPHDLVEDWRYRTGRDSFGDPALRIMLYLPDAKLEAFLDRASVAEKAIQELVFEYGKPYWPFVSVRMSSDLAEVLAEDE